MSAYADICDALTTGVRGITPQTEQDYTFTSQDDGHGSEGAPGDWIMDPRRVDRDFDIRATGTATGDGTNELVTSGVLRISYRLNRDLGLLDRMIQEDAQTITANVVRNPLYWGGAWSVSAGELSAEIVTDGDDNPSNVVISIPLDLRYPLRCEMTPPVYPRVISAQSEPGQRIKLALEAVDYTGRRVTDATAITLRYFAADGSAESPTFWVEHVPEAAWSSDTSGRLRPRFLTSVRTSVMTGKGDECATITTASGFAELTLFYAGTKPGEHKIEASIGRRKAIATASTHGTRRFCEPSNPAAANNPYPTNGTEAAPWASLAYAEDQMEFQDQARDVALCLKGDQVWVNSAGFSFGGAAIVAVEPGVFLSGYPSPYNRFSSDMGVVRGFGVGPNVARAVSCLTLTRVLIAGVDGDIIAGQIGFAQTESPAMRLLGCRVTSSEADRAISSTAAQGNEGVLEALHCDLPAVSECVYAGASSSRQFSSVSVHHCTLSGADVGFFGSSTLGRALVDSVLATDFNTYESITDLVIDDGVTYDLAAWKAATPGNDDNSTETP